MNDETLYRWIYVSGPLPAFTFSCRECVRGVFYRPRMRARRSGETVRSVAAVPCIGASPVVKWSQRFRATGSGAPGRAGGHRPRLIVGADETRLRERRAAGVDIFLPPPYSPDLNPIEPVFAKLKHLLRKAAGRTADAAWKRIGERLDHFSADECLNYPVNAGCTST